MSSVFPGALDTFATDKTNATAQTTDHPAHHNDLADAVNKVEAELGVDPAGAAATVGARLDVVEDGEVWDLGTWHAPPRLGAIASGVPGANSLRFVHVVIPQQALLTGIAYIVGTTSNGNVKVGLFDAAGARVAATTGTVAQAAINTNQKVAFDATLLAPPGVYFLAAILSSATGTWYTTNGAIPSSSAAPGSFDVPASITVPTTSLGATIPVLTTY